MATKVSTDIASVVDITARRNDSFYLKVELTNPDGTIYDIVGADGVAFESLFEIYDSNDVLILGFLSGSDSNSSTVNSVIVVDGSKAELVIDVPATNMTIRSGTYKYKFYVKHTTDAVTNTIMVGKFKVTDI